MAEEKEYDVSQEGTEIAAAIIERYSDSLVGINPASVVVMLLTNKNPPKKKRRKIAVCHRLDPITKAFLRYYQCPNVLYMIEFYGCEWAEMSTPRRHWVLFHELIHIPTPGHESLVKHNVEDFSPLLSTEYGLDWFGNPNLPDLLEGEKQQFDVERIVQLREES